MSDKWVELLPKEQIALPTVNFHGEGEWEYDYNQCLEDVINALKGKVILVDELPSEKELFDLIIESSLCHLCLSNAGEGEQECRELAKSIHDLIVGK